MVSKQKSIFDKESIKIKTQVGQSKTKDNTVPLEESIFAKYSKQSKKTVSVDNNKFVIEDDTVPLEESIFAKPSKKEETKFLVHDDEVPIEESIFAKKKKQSYSIVPIDNKIDLEVLFNKYKDLYMNECILNTNRLNMIDSATFNTCCINLDNSLKTDIMNIESYIVSKRIIKSSCDSVEDAFYCYTNMNRVLIDLISELNPGIDSNILWHIIDKSYAEVINEFGGINGKNNKKC